MSINKIDQFVKESSDASITTDIDNSLARYIAKASCPLQTVENDAFKEFVIFLNPNLSQ